MNLSKTLLLIISLVLYATLDIRALPILIGTIAVTYVGALAIEKLRAYGKQLKSKVVFLFIIICFISVFILFRQSFVQLPFFPIGFSFYSLQALGYLIDVYRGASPEKNFMNYALYVSYFPTVLSGPIQMRSGLLTKINRGPVHTYESARRGLYLIAYGLFAKLVVADRLAGVVDYAFDYYYAQTGLALALGEMCYCIRLYADFMGYSCIAIGASSLLGYELTPNFSRPFFSKSMRELWSRWHISLMNWFKEYIYKPVTGYKRGGFRTLVGILVVFLVSGFWHGFGLTFIVWGLLNGLVRVVETCIYRWRKAKGIAEKGGHLINALRMIRTCFVFWFVFIFFRSESMSQAMEIIKRIFIKPEILTSFTDGRIKLGWTKFQWAYMLLGISVIFVVDLIQEKGIKLSERFGRLPAAIRWGVYMAYIVFMILVYICFFGGDAGKFMYTRF